MEKLKQGARLRTAAFRLAFAVNSKPDFAFYWRKMKEAAFKGLVILPCYNQIILFQCSGCFLGPAVCLLFHVINIVSILLHLSIVPGCIQRLPFGNCASLFWIALSGNIRWLPCKVCIYIFCMCNFCFLQHNMPIFISSWATGSDRTTIKCFLFFCFLIIIFMQNAYSIQCNKWRRHWTNIFVFFHTEIPVLLCS